MIPTHQSKRTQRSEIVINQLSTLNDYDFGHPHRHDYFELFCFIEGGGTHSIDFCDHTIGSFSIHIVAPGQVHQVKRELNSFGYVCLFELVSLQIAPEVEVFLFDHVCYDAKEHSPIYSIPEERKQWFQTTTDTLWEDYCGNAEHRQLQVRAFVSSLLTSCMVWNSSKNPVKTDEYVRFRRLLFKEFRRLKMVKDYASLIGMPEKLLNTIVKSHCGKNASQVIYDQIIVEAKRLLQTGMSAKETAYDLNFDDPAHFSKFFKGRTGMSPSEFRNVHV